MASKLLAGGFAALAIVGILNAAPGGDPGDSAHVAEFKTQCNRGIRTNNAPDFCRCIASNVDRRLQTPDEVRLAGGIVRAIGDTASLQNAFSTDEAASKDVLQAKFDRLSDEYEGSISPDRKEDVLLTVTSEIKSCELEMTKQSP